MNLDGTLDELRGELPADVDTHSLAWDRLENLVRFSPTC